MAYRVQVFDPDTLFTTRFFYSYMLTLCSAMEDLARNETEAVQARARGGILFGKVEISLNSYQRPCSPRAGATSPSYRSDETPHMRSSEYFSRRRSLVDPGIPSAVQFLHLGKVPCLSAPTSDLYRNRYIAIVRRVLPCWTTGMF